MRELEMKLSLHPETSNNQAFARLATTPEILSESALTVCQNIDRMRAEN